MEQKAFIGIITKGNLMDSMKISVSHLALSLLAAFSFVNTAKATTLTIENAVRVSFPTEVGKSYQLQSSQDLNPPQWTVRTNIQGTGSPFAFLQVTGISDIFRVEEYPLFDGLVGYWQFKGDSGDLSTNQNGAVVTAATLGTNRFGVVNDSYLFSGSGQYITTTNSAGFPLGKSDFTVSLWVKLTKPLPADHQLLLCNLTVGQFQLTISPNSTTLFPRPGSVEFLTGGAGHEDDLGTASLNWVVGEWYSVQVVRSTDILSIYRNGEHLGSKATANGNNAIGASRKLRFGNRDGGTHQFFGQMDDVRLYNRALTEAELSVLRDFVE